MRPAFPEAPTPAAEKLRSLIDSARGARVGQSAVVSTFAHVLDPHEPDTVEIAGDRDAGRTYYGRSETGRVLHVDVFHERAALSHRDVARFLSRRLTDWCRRAGIPASARDLIDIRTATGGGGLAPSSGHRGGRLEDAGHSTHVHLAWGYNSRHIALALALIWYTEEYIDRRGYGLRSPDRVVWAEIGEEGGGPAWGRRASGESPLAEGGRPGVSGPHPPGIPGYSPASLSSERLGAEYERTGLYSTAVMEAAWEVGSVATVGAILRVADKGLRNRSTLPPAVSWQQLDEICARLKRRGFMTGQVPRDWALTPSGVRLLQFLERHGRELESGLRRRILQTARRRAGIGGWRLSVPERGRSRGRTAVPVDVGPLRSLAVPETMRAYFARGLTVGETPGSFRLQRSDLRVNHKDSRRAADVCLIIDGSASMAGRRLASARHLARHLLNYGRDRVAVVLFQEDNTRVLVPFTRHLPSVAETLDRIRPFGLTPLAAGLEEAAALLRQGRHRRDPLAILISDGIPTVTRAGLNPIEDAERAAALLARAGARLVCIGLEPNERYLSRIAAAGRGSLHVVKELDAAHLLLIASSERNEAPH